MSRRIITNCSLVAALWLLSAAPAQAQFFFEADAVFMDRAGGSGAGALINGSNPVTASGLSSGFEPGYRLNLGSQFFEYQIDTSFTQISPWSSSGTGTLTNLLIFDDTVGNPVVDPGGLANSIAFPNGLFSATSVPLAEQTESERLQGGSTWTYLERSNYRDFEINFGSARDMRRWRAGVGYRHIKYDGRSQFVLSGVFDAIDTADAAVSGDATNRPNDALAANSMLEAGFIGAGSFDAFDAVVDPNRLTYASTGRADNELHGAQATFGLRLFDGNWVTVEGTAKAGIYQNNVRGELTEVVIGSGGSAATFGRGFADRKTNAAFAGGLGMKATMSLTDYINLIGGYEMTVLSGIGVAGDQTRGLSADPLTGGPVYSVNNTADLLLHGGTIGVEVTW